MVLLSCLLTSKLNLTFISRFDSDLMPNLHDVLCVALKWFQGMLTKCQMVCNKNKGRYVKLGLARVSWVTIDSNPSKSG